MLRICPPDSGRIILDCDEVMLRYFPNFAEYVTREHGVTIQAPAPLAYDMSEWLGISDQDRIFEMIRQFNNGAETGFGELKAVEGAVDKVRALKDAGYELHVLTMASDNPAAIARRVGNLERVFGTDVFEDVISLALRDSKAEHLKKHAPSIFIDDLPKNVRLGEEAGHHSILMKSTHNEAFIMEGADGLDHLHGWEDFRISPDCDLAGPDMPS